MASLVFLGTPDLAVPALDALVDAGHTVELVITQPDKRRGRSSVLTPSPVKGAALRLGIPVSHVVEDVLQTPATLGIVVAFGQLIKPNVLAKLPMINTHFSLLPRWRGAAPVERALLAGDQKTGVCLMQLEAGLDTGPILATTVVSIEPRDTLHSLRTRLVEIGTSMLIDGLENGFGEPVAQVGEPTTATKLSKDEFQIDWSKSAIELDRLVRVAPAFTTLDGKRFKLHEAELLDAGDIPDAPHVGTLRQIDNATVAVLTGDSWLRLVRVQPEGKSVMTAEAWLAGLRRAPDNEPIRFT